MRLRLSTLVCVVLAGCGDCGSQHEPDAAGTDSNVADGAGDAPRGVVQLTVYGDGALMPNVPVVFLDATDAVVAQMVTDTQGVASTTMAAGGSVTAVLPGMTEPASPHVFTYLDVKPGDHLVLGTPTPIATTAPLTLPSYTGAASYRVTISCGAATPTLVSATCSPVSFYVAAQDDMMRTLAWFYVPAVVVMQDIAIDLSNHSYEPPSEVLVTINGVPSTVGAFSIEGAVAVGDFTFASVESAAAPSTGSQRTGILALPAVTGADTIIMPNLQNATTKDKQTFYVRAPFATTSSIDVSTPPTPWFKGASGDVTTNEIRISEEGSGTTDVASVQLRVERSFDDFYWWMVAGPYTPTKLRLPKLSGSFEQFNLAPGVDARSAGVGYTARIMDGWDGLRANAMNAGALTARLLQGAGVVSTAETTTIP